MTLIASGLGLSVTGAMLLERHGCKVRNPEDLTRFPSGGPLEDPPILRPADERAERAADWRVQFGEGVVHRPPGAGEVPVVRLRPGCPRDLREPTSL
jgi:hypothetical protein